MADVLPTLKERTAGLNGEVLSFSETEALRALDAIITRRPQVVRIERTFASTPRGAALINRIKADPGLVDMGIEVVSHDSDETRIVRQGAASRVAKPAAPPPAKKAPVPLAPRAASIAPPSPRSEAAPAPAPPPPAAAPETAPAAAPLDKRGTREAARFRMEPGLEITVDGNNATLVDLSTVGAQVIASGALKPNQRVRLALNDDAGSVKIAGKVVWASFEITKGGPRYRAGIQFVKPDAPAIEAFCARHKAAT